MVPTQKHPIGIVQIVCNDENKQYDCKILRQLLNKKGFVVQDVPVYQLKDRLMSASKKYELPILLFGYGASGQIIQNILYQTDLCRGAVLLDDARPVSVFSKKLAILLAWCTMMIMGQNKPAKAFVRRPIHGISPQNTHTTYREYWAYLRDIFSIKHTQNCAPLMMINSDNNITKMGGRMSRTLYNAYRQNDLSKLTLMFYADLFNANTLRQVHNDIVQFMHNVVNRK